MMNLKQISISLDDIEGVSFQPTKAQADTAWNKFDRVVNAQYFNGSNVVKMGKRYGFNEAIGRAFEINVLEFAR